MALLAPRKRLFVSLLSGSLACLAILMLLMWFLSDRRLYTYQRTVIILGVMFALAVLLLVAVGVAGLILTLWRGRMVPLINNLTSVAVNILFPITLKVGRLFGIDQDKIKGSFIEVNNQLVTTKRLHVKPEEMLVLAPHCLQYNGCPHKITRDIHNCKGCGKCQVASFLRFHDELQINVAIVTGGTLARKYITEYRPQVVVAVACERDLTSGILDSYPLPVYGVLNERPHGPCQDTRVCLEQVEKAIYEFTKGPNV